MIIKKEGKFVPCPEFTGRAVCVDVTPLKTVQSKFGDREVFRIVFEVDLQKEDGTRWCAWSAGFTPTLHEKSGLRKFLKQWFGRDLTDAELVGLDTETLVGRPAWVDIVHETGKEGAIYANIAMCRPHRDGDALLPSGKYRRVKDRDHDDSAYRRTTAPAGAAAVAEASGPDKYLTTKIHVGRYKGIEIRECSNEALQKLVDMWLPAARQAAKPTADDRRLIAALEWWVAETTKSAVPAPKEEDDIPY